MSIRKRLQIMLAAALLSAGLGLAAGLIELVRLSGLIDENQVAAEALGNHQEADMMHDALRGDVLAALLAKRLGTPATEVESALQEHAAEIRKRVAANKDLPLDSRIRHQLNLVQAPLNEYVEAAISLTALGLKDPEAGAAQLPAFMEKFEALEESLGNVRIEIEKLVNATTDNSQSEAKLGTWLMILAVVVNAGTLAFQWFGTMNHVINPITRVAELLAGLTAGRKDADISGLPREHEIGVLVNAVQSLKDAAIAREAAERAQEEARRREADAQAEAAQRQRAEAEAVKKRADNMAAAISQFESRSNTAIGALDMAAQQLKSAGENLSGIMGRTTSLAEEVSRAANEVSGEVQSVSAATSQFAQSTGEIAERVNQSSATTAAAVREAEQASADVVALADAGQRIGQIVQVIAEIASRTDLLALNATIEAARAGEAGKGFAVVASEVKALSLQTTRATEEIGTQIQSIQQATRVTANRIEEVASAVGRIDNIVGSVAAAVEEQTAATRAMAESSTRASDRTMAVSGNIQEVSAGSSQASHVSADVLSAAERLEGEANALKDGIRQFIEQVRAA